MFRVPKKLTDSSGGTASVSTIAAMAAPGDSPATADALRDDLVTNFITPAINNIASLTGMVNKLQEVVLALAQQQ